jgi:hypothetical protein
MVTVVFGITLEKNETALSESIITPSSIKIKITSKSFKESENAYINASSVNALLNRTNITVLPWVTKIKLIITVITANGINKIMLFFKDDNLPVTTRIHIVGTNTPLIITGLSEHITNINKTKLSTSVENTWML